MQGLDGWWSLGFWYQLLRLAISGCTVMKETLKPVDLSDWNYRKILTRSTSYHCSRPRCQGWISAILARLIPSWKKRGTSHIKFVCLVSAPEGWKLFKKLTDVDIFTAALDDHLNEHGYIVPDLGDTRWPFIRYQIRNHSWFVQECLKFDLFWPLVYNSTYTLNLNWREWMRSLKRKEYRWFQWLLDHK